MAVAVMIDGREAATALSVVLGEGKFINLGAVLILCEAQFEGAGVEVLVSAAAVIPAAPQRAVGIHVELLLAEVVGVVVHRAGEGAFGVSAELSPRVHGIANVARGDGGF